MRIQWKLRPSGNVVRRSQHELLAIATEGQAMSVSVSRGEEVLPTVLVAGASLGGLRAAEQLRAAGWTGRIVVAGDEPHMPYNRPPLSKAALRDITLDGDSVEGARRLAETHALKLRPSLADVDWRLGSRVSAVSLDDHVAELADSSRIAFDGLVIATGLRPRRLSAEHVLRGRHALRTVQDVFALRSELVPGSRMVVVGGGFIGCEIAATARLLGCEVTVVEPLEAPMVRALGPELGRAMQRYHEGHGVRFEVGRGVDSLQADETGAMSAVTLDDGRVLPCEVLIEAIGCQPNVEWLEGNGLDLSDGVVCDSWMRVEGRGDVVAVGDVARFPNARFDERPRRVEHWSIATDTARRAAPALVGWLTARRFPRDGFECLPSFWSDQFDARIQGVGAFGLADTHQLLEGTLDRPDRGVVMSGLRQGRLVAVVAVGVGPSTFRRHTDSLRESR